MLQTPTRHTPRRLATPKSVRIQPAVVSDMTTPYSDITPMSKSVRQHGEARPKTPMIARTPLAPSIRPSPYLPTPPLVPRRILSSTP